MDQNEKRVTGSDLLGLVGRKSYPAHIYLI